MPARFGFGYKFSISELVMAGFCDADGKCTAHRVNSDKNTLCGACEPVRAAICFSTSILNVHL
jgi:hypothetical protein